MLQVKLLWDGAEATLAMCRLVAAVGLFCLSCTDTCRGGASHVTTVDVAEAAIASAAANWELNGLDSRRHEGVVSEIGVLRCIRL
jgi:tRNA/tmRNA/rRNA uracil-C5-methylase (TrmA/RlmC/RlmD family)